MAQKYYNNRFIEASRFFETAKFNYLKESGTLSLHSNFIKQPKIL